MTSVALLQCAAGLLVFLAYAWLVGSTCSRFCLGAGAGQTLFGSAQAMRNGEPLAALAGVVGAAMSLYAAAATMSAMPLASAHQVLWTTMTQTAVGRHGLSAMLLMVLIGMACTVLSGPWRDRALLLLLPALAGARCMTTHAAEHGMWSVDFAMEWLHLMFIALWIGIVVMAAWIIVPRHRDAGLGHQGQRVLYLHRLSQAATAALLVILATGIYNTVVRFGAWDNVGGNTYSTTLMFKGAMVALALAIGAYNRFVGFPAIVSSGRVTPSVLLLLRAESFLLVGALLAAVLLGSMPPPSSL